MKGAPLPPVDVSRHLEPARTRPEIEWSVAISRTGIADDRFVIYGLDDSEVRAFLAARGHDPAPALQGLWDAVGAPVQVAVGKDGDRTKVYWFLRGDDPYFLGLDLGPGRPPAVKHYRLVEPASAARALELVEAPLRPHLGWLLEQEEVQPPGLFHVVLLSRGGPASYSAAHVGLRQDWEGLLDRAPRLRRPRLVRALLGRLGFEQAWPTVERSLLQPPMAWTAYVSVLMRPDGSVGANVYSRSDPVVEVGGGLGIVEPGRGGMRPRPVRIDLRLARRADLVARMRASTPGPSLAERGGWQLDYQAPGVAAEALMADGTIQELEEVFRRATEIGSPREPVAVLAALRIDGRVAEAGIVPDMGA